MAIVYVDSNASGAANGTSWTDAYATLTAAYTAETTDGTEFWVASNHSESAASFTYTIAAYCSTTSVNSSTDAYASGAAIVCTGTDITIDGSHNSFNGLQITGYRDLLIIAENTIFTDITYSNTAGNTNGELLPGNGASLYFYDSDITLIGAKFLDQARGCHIEFEKCTLSSAGGGIISTIDSLQISTLFVDCDLSGFTTTSSLIGLVGDWITKHHRVPGYT